MRRFLLINYILLTSILITFSQNSSPYVETATVSLNNSGFKSTSKRPANITGQMAGHVDSDPANAVVSNRFVVGKNDVTLLLLIYTGTWALTNGFDLSLDLGLASIGLSLPTGCNAYFESGASAGTWRVPTQRELILIYLVKKELESISGFDSFTATPYWTSTQKNGTNAWAINMSTGFNSATAKNSAYRVRCIRDI